MCIANGCYHLRLTADDGVRAGVHPNIPRVDPLFGTLILRIGSASIQRRLRLQNCILNQFLYIV